MSAIRSRFSILLLAFAAACGGGTVAGSANGGSQGSKNTTTTTGGGGSSGFVARIIQPNGNISIMSGDTFTLQAQFTDGGNPVMPASVSWDAGVFLGKANPQTGVSLTTGTHTVTVTGLYNGHQATDSVTVTVGGLAVKILHPNDGRIETAGTSLRFVGTATASGSAGNVQLVSGTPLTGQRTASFAWSSSIDGAMGTGDQLNINTLSVGTHTITLTVTDNGTNGTGASGSASITVVIDTRPQVSITAPASCPVEIEQGSTLTLTGTVTDPDAADAGLKGRWTDSIGGTTQAGDSMTYGSGAALGKHDLVFSATDSAGATDQATCTIYVVPAGQSGAARMGAALFPNSASINNNLAAGNQRINWIGTVGDGATWIGNDQGLTTFDSSGTSTGTFNATDLGVDTGGTQIYGAARAGSTAFVATDAGMAACDYAGGTITNTPCTSLSDRSFQAVSASGDTASSATVAGASNDGLFLASYAGGSLDQSFLFTADNSNLPTNNVSDVQLVDSTLYVATTEGLCVVDNTTAALAAANAGGAGGGGVQLCSTVLTTDNSLLPRNHLTALAYDGTTLWIGTNDGGLVAYDPATGSMKSYQGTNGLPDSINDIAVDASGVLWIASDQGVYRFDPTSGLVTHFDHTDFGTTTDRVLSIFIDGNGTKWFGTDQGVVQYTGA